MAANLKRAPGAGPDPAAAHPSRGLHLRRHRRRAAARSVHRLPAPQGAERRRAHPRRDRRSARLLLHRAPRAPPAQGAHREPVKCPKQPSSRRREGITRRLAREVLAELAGRAPTSSIYSEAVHELVAIGAAIAANCEPCFRHHFDKARKLGVSKEDMARAVTTAQMVKESPARAVLELAEKYVGSKIVMKQGLDACRAAVDTELLGTGSAPAPKKCCRGRDRPRAPRDASPLTRCGSSRCRRPGPGSWSRAPTEDHGRGRDLCGSGAARPARAAEHDGPRGNTSPTSSGRRRRG